MISRLFSAPLVLMFALGCANASDGAENASPISSACSAEATSCPSSCAGGNASRYDQTRHCWQAEAIVTCTAPERRTFDYPCGVRSSDGAILRASSSILAQFDYVDCGEGEWDEAPACQ